MAIFDSESDDAHDAPNDAPSDSESDFESEKLAYYNSRGFDNHGDTESPSLVGDDERGPSTPSERSNGKRSTATRPSFDATETTTTREEFIRPTVPEYNPFRLPGIPICTPTKASVSARTPPAIINHLRRNIDNLIEGSPSKLSRSKSQTDLADYAFATSSAALSTNQSSYGPASAYQPAYGHAPSANHSSYMPAHSPYHTSYGSTSSAYQHAFVQSSPARSVYQPSSERAFSASSSSSSNGPIVDAPYQTAPGQNIRHKSSVNSNGYPVPSHSARDHLFGRHPRVSHNPNAVRFAHPTAPLHHRLQHSTPLRPPTASATLSDMVSHSSVSVPPAQDCALSASDLSSPTLVANEMNNKINDYLATGSSTGPDLVIDQIENCLEIMQRNETKDEIKASLKFRRLYVTTPLGRLPSAAVCKSLAPTALQALTLVPIRKILFGPSGSTDRDTLLTDIERIPTNADIECTDPDPLNAEDTEPIDNDAGKTLRSNSSALFCFEKGPDKYYCKILKEVDGATTVCNNGQRTASGRRKHLMRKHPAILADIEYFQERQRRASLILETLKQDALPPTPSKSKRSKTAHILNTNTRTAFAWSEAQQQSAEHQLMRLIAVDGLPFHVATSATLKEIFRILNPHNMLDRVVDEWSLTSKVVGITSDQGANIKKGLQECEQNTGAYWVACTAHKMQLCINKAWSKTNPLVDITSKCVAIISFFNNNSVAKKVLNGKWDTYLIAARRADSVPLLAQAPTLDAVSSTPADGASTLAQLLPANVGPCANLPQAPSTDGAPAQAQLPSDDVEPIANLQPSVPSFRSLRYKQEEVTLVSANATRWNSKLAMISRFLDISPVLRKTFEALFQLDKISADERAKFKTIEKLLPTDDELELLKEIDQLLILRRTSHTGLEAQDTRPSRRLASKLMASFQTRHSSRQGRRFCY
ncbi:hypothetical protein BGX30_009542 [Mortierella sp. GBA39]|nr:hypothetical protein BGX30_009542 [Mortierella sp. GBA39]